VTAPWRVAITLPAPSRHTTVSSPPAIPRRLGPAGLPLSLAHRTPPLHLETRCAWA
jgi:hypothetical protein